MDFRLLHGVAYGHTWFGRWDYRFCNGSFGITQTKYEEAVDFVSSLELEKMMSYFRNSCLHTSFRRIIRYYQSLSETSLIIIRDLLRFSLTLTSTVKFNKKSTCSKPFYQHLSRISNMAYRLENLTDLEVINKATEYWEILLKKILKNYPAAKASVQIILDTDCFAKVWVEESDRYKGSCLEAPEVANDQGKGSCLEAPEVANDQGKSPPPLNHQGGEKVRCICGATVNDGHQMIACDICHVWHHTRCNNIKDGKASPETFTCYICLEN